MNSKTHPLQAFWPTMAAAALVLAIYLPLLNAPLVWDDRSVITQNLRLEHPIALSSYVKRDYYEFSGEQSWRPLATLSYAALVGLFGKSPAALRGFHLLLHALNAGLLAALLISLGLGASCAAWGAALFLAHAAHVETLMCVAFNEEILAGLWILAMLLAHRRKRAALAALAFALALLSKETGVIGFALAFLSDLVEKNKPWRRWRDYLIYGVLLGAYLAIHFGPLKGPSAGEEAFVVPFSDRLFFAITATATAARVFFLPLGLRLEYFALPASEARQWLIWGSMTVLLFAVWATFAWRLWKTRPAVALLLIWPAIFLALTSPLWPVAVFNTRLFAERWLYLPTLGLAGALAYGISRRPAWGAALLLFWGACGYVRAQDWAQEERLWRSLARIYPWCAKAQEGLGEALFRRGDAGAALQAFRAAQDLRESRQDQVLAYYAPLSQGRFVRWESPTLYRWLGHALIKTGDLENADENFSKAAALDIADGFTYRIMSYSWAKAGNFAKAHEWLKRGLERRPPDPFLQRLEIDVSKRRLTFGASFD